MSDKVERWVVLGEDSYEGIPFIDIATHDVPHPDYQSVCHVQANGTDEDGELSFELTGADWERARLIANAPKTLKQRDALAALLKLYRNETPLGHQPHMIAHEVDAVLATLEDEQ